jgi:hypothetical protein
MPRFCEECRQPVELLDTQTASWNMVWHTRCWNRAEELRAATLAEDKDPQDIDLPNIRKPARSIVVEVFKITQEVA